MSLRKIGGLNVSALSLSRAEIGMVENALTYFMQPQEETNWCWSAVGTSVGLFFATGSWTQCGTASAMFSGRDCCATPGDCNFTYYLENALTYTKSLDTWFSGRYSATDLEAQIDLGHPVCVRIVWNGGNVAHFLAMTGYSYPSASPDQVVVFLQDSIYGPSAMLLADFAAQYQGGATWSHTYLTEPH